MDKKQDLSGFRVLATPTDLSDQSQGYTGYIYLSTNNFKSFLRANDGVKPIYVTCKGFTFTLEEDKILDDASIGIGKYPRKYMGLNKIDKIEINLFKPKKDISQALTKLKLKVTLGIKLTTKPIDVDTKHMEKQFRSIFSNQYIGKNQIQLLDYSGGIFVLEIEDSIRVDMKAPDLMVMGVQGLLLDDTMIVWEFDQTPDFNLLDRKNDATPIKPEIEAGGVDKQIEQIFTRLFIQRRVPPPIMKKYGLSFARGLLLYGPPGTGKTLIASQLAKSLNAVPPKYINGSELFDRYVGETEKKIKELFKDALEEQKQKGDKSRLHVIVFDEFDALAKKRGTVQNNAGVGDTAVNMLLTMIEGLNPLNNILVIAMTNRKDMIDEALLRDGRFEVHIEIGLPDEKGRAQILKIHTKEMTKNKVLGEDVDLNKLAAMTENYVGAELRTLVVKAGALAFKRANPDLMDFTKELQIRDDTPVCNQDFLDAIDITKPMFGAENEKIDYLLRGKLFDFGERYQKNVDIVKSLIDQLKKGSSTQIVSLLLEGQKGSGKTSFAAWAAKQSKFPFIKIITPKNLIGYYENGKVDTIVKVFNDGYRSQFSLIILDEIERLIEFVPVGMRFSNLLLQCLMVYVKEIPNNKDCKIMVIGTTSSLDVLKELELDQSFDVVAHVPTLSEVEIYNVLCQYEGEKDEFKNIASSLKEITMKKLLLLINMATQDDGFITYNRFMQCYYNCGKL